MKSTLKEALKTSMKAQDRLKTETIRSLLSEIQYEEMQRQINELSPSDCAIVLQRELKKRNEAIPFEEQANRPEAKAKLLAEVAIIEEFLPKQMSSAKLEELLNTYKSTTDQASMSTAMKYLKENFAGQYDGKSASEIAKRVFA